MRELLETVDQLNARGIGLVSIEEKIDTSSAAGELVFHVFGAIAHFERRLIAERTRDGLAVAAANGTRGSAFLPVAGHIAVPAGPGLGIEPDADVIRAYAVPAI